tara:strand:- start:1627 stop:2304 length:678 start_codon:yes stop_codon:yes gene_type:complete
MNNQLTIIQNFIVTKPGRLQIIKKQFNNLGKILGEYKFIVNYDTKTYLKEIKSLYEKNIPNFYFSNVVGQSWSKTTRSLIEKCTTPYIYYLVEDNIFFPETTNKHFNSMLNEFISNKCINLNLGKVEKYRIEHHWGENSTKHKFIRTFRTDHSPIHCLPLAGIWDKNLFLEVLDTIKESSAYNELLQFEANSNLFRSPKYIASTPVVRVIDHEENVNGKTIKEWK